MVKTKVKTAKGWEEIGGGASFIEIKYSELKQLIEDEELEVGSSYRITDFATKVNSNFSIPASPLLFDVVVTANSKTTFFAEAKAMENADASYTTKPDFAKWQLKVDFNASKYNWTAGSTEQKWFLSNEEVTEANIINTDTTAPIYMNDFSSAPTVLYTFYKVYKNGVATNYYTRDVILDTTSYTSTALYSNFVFTADPSSTLQVKIETEVEKGKHYVTDSYLNLYRLPQHDIKDESTGIQYYAYGTAEVITDLDYVLGFLEEELTVGTEYDAQYLDLDNITYTTETITAEKKEISILAPTGYKGTISYMKDEFNNEAGYDFKNVLYEGKFTYQDIAGTDMSLNGANCIGNTIVPSYDKTNGVWVLPKIAINAEKCKYVTFRQNTTGITLTTDIAGTGLTHCEFDADCGGIELAVTSECKTFNRCYFQSSIDSGTLTANSNTKNGDTYTLIYSINDEVVYRNVDRMIQTSRVYAQTTEPTDAKNNDVWFVINSSKAVTGLKVRIDSVWTDVSLGGASIIEMTHADLLALKNSDGLTPGQQYRITNYACSINSTVTDVSVAGKQFDILVTATSSSTLDAHARAINHVFDEGVEDPFAKCDLSAWELSYSLECNTNRYTWCNASGTGVIYRMKDEYGNSCGYDFKNIKFSDSINEYYTFSYNSSDYPDITTLGQSKLQLAGCSCCNNTIEPCIRLRSTGREEEELPHNFIRVSTECLNNTFKKGAEYIHCYTTNMWCNTFENEVYYVKVYKECDGVHFYRCAGTSSSYLEYSDSTVPYCPGTAHPKTAVWNTTKSIWDVSSKNYRDVIHYGSTQSFFTSNVTNMKFHYCKLTRQGNVYTLYLGMQFTGTNTFAVGAQVQIATAGTNTLLAKRTTYAATGSMFMQSAGRGGSITLANDGTLWACFGPLGTSTSSGYLSQVYSAANGNKWQASITFIADDNASVD